jgi:hypothetical protein
LAGSKGVSRGVKSATLWPWQHRRCTSGNATSTCSMSCECQHVPSPASLHPPLLLLLVGNKRFCCEYSQTKQTEWRKMPTDCLHSTRSRQDPSKERVVAASLPICTASFPHAQHRQMRGLAHKWEPHLPRADSHRLHLALPAQVADYLRLGTLLMPDGGSTELTSEVCLPCCFLASTPPCILCHLARFTSPVERSCEDPKEIRRQLASHCVHARHSYVHPKASTVLRAMHTQPTNFVMSSTHVATRILTP